MYLVILSIVNTKLLFFYKIMCSFNQTFAVEIKHGSVFFIFVTVLADTKKPVSRSGGYKKIPIYVTYFMFSIHACNFVLDVSRELLVFFFFGKMHIKIEIIRHSITSEYSLC